METSSLAGEPNAEAAKQSALTELREALDKVPNATRFDMDQVKNAVLQRHELIETGSEQILPELNLMKKTGTFNKPLPQVAAELRPRVRKFLQARIKGHERPDEVAQMVRGFVRRTRSSGTARGSKTDEASGRHRRPRSARKRRRPRRPERCCGRAG